MFQDDILGFEESEDEQNFESFSNDYFKFNESPLSIQSQKKPSIPTSSSSFFDFSLQSTYQENTNSYMKPSSDSLSDKSYDWQYSRPIDSNNVFNSIPPVIGLVLQPIFISTIQTESPTSDSDNKSNFSVTENDRIDNLDILTLFTGGSNDTQTDVEDETIYNMTDSSEEDSTEQTTSTETDSIEFITTSNTLIVIDSDQVNDNERMVDTSTDAVESVTLVTQKNISSSAESSSTNEDVETGSTIDITIPPTTIMPSNQNRPSARRLFPLRNVNINSDFQTEKSAGLEQRDVSTIDEGTAKSATTQTNNASSNTEITLLDTLTTKVMATKSYLPPIQTAGIISTTESNTSDS